MYSARPRLLSALLVVLAYLLSPTGSRADPPQAVTIAGSDLTVQLASRWAEASMAENPQFDVTVDGGGSGVGMARLLLDTTGICCSSRSAEPREESEAREKGVRLVPHPIGHMCIAVIVHPANPVRQLSLPQLKDILTGKVTDWHTVGGPEAEIEVLSFPSEMATGHFLDSRLLGDQAVAPTGRLVMDSGSMIEVVRTRPHAIGYVDLPDAVQAGQTVVCVSLRAGLGEPAVLPSNSSARDGTYSLAQTQYLYTRGRPRHAPRRFIEFALSSEGQKLVQESGLVPVRELR